MNDKMLPKHIALIVDGNRRWAKERGLNPFYGHEVGIKKVLPTIIKFAHSMGIEEVTAWIFSTENWDRSSEEVAHLMKLFREFTGELLKYSTTNNMQVHHVGKRDRLPAELIKNLDVLEAKTGSFGKRLNLCIDYGGKDEISRAVSDLISNNTKLSKISVELISDYIRKSNGFINNPDLIIRTGGEQRLSGFMSWDSAYAELVFEKTYFPAFTKDKLKKWITHYSSRERRFGK